MSSSNRHDSPRKSVLAQPDMREFDPSEQNDRLRERGRGRQADAPSQIPMRGWKDILLRVYQNIGKDRVLVIAAGVTFYCLLALFPAVAALVAIYGLFADPASLTSYLQSMAGVLPDGAIDVIRDQMSRIASHGASTLSLTFLAGLAVSLWSANAGVKSMFDALNLVYNEEEKRGLIKLNLISLAFTAAAILFLILAVAALVVLPVALNYVGLGGVTKWLADLGRWPVLLVVVAVALAALYRFGPSRREPKWRWLSYGSAFAAVVWIAMSVLFSWYATNFGSYNATYGSLGAVIGFMVWMWLSTIVILIGAEINAEMEHQTSQDTTVGAPKPLGARQAVMADTIGAAQR